MTTQENDQVTTLNPNEEGIIASAKFFAHANGQLSDSNRSGLDIFTPTPNNRKVKIELIQNGLVLQPFVERLHVLSQALVASNTQLAANQGKQRLHCLTFKPVPRRSNDWWSILMIQTKDAEAAKAAQQAALERDPDAAAILFSDIESWLQANEAKSKPMCEAARRTIDALAKVRVDEGKRLASQAKKMPTLYPLDSMMILFISSGSPTGGEVEAQWWTNFSIQNQGQGGNYAASDTTGGGPPIAYGEN